MKLLNQNILVKKDEEKETTQSGIVLVEQNDKMYVTGEVIDWAGDTDFLKFKKGDHILFMKYGADEVEIENQTYLILKEEQIICIL